MFKNFVEDTETFSDQPDKEDSFEKNFDDESSEKDLAEENHFKESSSFKNTHINYQLIKVLWSSVKIRNFQRTKLLTLIRAGFLGARSRWG